MWTENFQMFKLDLEKAKEPEIKLPISVGLLKKQKCSRKTSISDLLTMPNFDCVDHSKLWKILKEMGIPVHLTCLLSNLYAGQEATVRTVLGTTDWLQIGKGCILYVKAVYCHPAYLTYMQSTSLEMLDAAQYGSRLLGEISITSDMQMSSPLWQKAKKN